MSFKLEPQFTTAPWLQLKRLFSDETKQEESRLLEILVYGAYGADCNKWKICTEMHY